jgi:protein-arginine deiminase
LTVRLLVTSAFVGLCVPALLAACGNDSNAGHVGETIAPIDPVPVPTAGAPGMPPMPPLPPDDTGTDAPLPGASDAGADAMPPEMQAEPTPPVAVLTVTPDTGTVPLQVTLDATMSHDADDPPDALVARFDFDGDGAWDTDYLSERTVDVTYEAVGSYAVLVEVQDTDAMTDVADGPVTITVQESDAPYADIAVDSNRDGVIDVLDDMHEAEWSAEFGATFLANLDDDDENGTRDGKNETSEGAPDADDLLPLFVRKVNGLTAGQTVRVTVGPQVGSDAVRLFTASGTLLKGTGSTTATIPGTDIGAGDVELRIESSTGRTATWDGEITLDLEVVEGATVVASDQAIMRVAPIILPDDTREMETLHVMRIAGLGSSPNLPFYDAIVANLPSGIDLYTVSEVTYGGDRWVQDSMQTGYQSVPTSDGVRRVDTHLQAERNRGGASLFSLLPDGLLGANLGYAYPGGSDTSHNYGGNLEVMPPNEDFPLGRLIVGGGSVGTLLGYARTDRMTSAQAEWLDAQGAQGPALEVSTEWLSVGHVDEIFVVIPDRSGAGGRGWKVVIASPDLAINALEDLQSKGQGSLPVFDGRSPETTVSAILGNSSLMQFNTAAQARIDSVRMILSDEFALTDDDFVELPVMYEPHWSGPADMAAAYNPGMQNLIAANDVLFVPDPEGPGTAWEDMTRDALEATGHEVVFVDVFNSYHLLFGEAHCGANFTRAPYDTAWWEVLP